MKAVKFLLFSILTLLFVTGCEVAKEQCESNSDCGEGDKCYAGYCSSVVPDGGFFVKINIVNEEDGQEFLTCDQTEIDKVTLEFKRGTFKLPVTDDNSFNDGTSYSYVYNVDCEDISAEDLGYSNGLYVGGDIDNYNSAQGPFQQQKDYVMIATYKNGSGSVVAQKEYDVTAYTIPVEMPENNNTVEVTKVEAAVLNITFMINNGGDMCMSDDTSACDDLGITRLMVSRDGFADEDNTYEDYEEISYSSQWLYTENITEAYNSSLYVYAVDGSGDKIASYEGTLNISQEDFDTGEVTKTIMLNVLSNKK